MVNYILTYEHMVSASRLRGWWSALDGQLYLTYEHMVSARGLRGGGPP